MYIANSPFNITDNTTNFENHHYIYILAGIVIVSLELLL